MGSKSSMETSSHPGTARRSSQVMKESNTPHHYMTDGTAAPQVQVNDETGTPYPPIINGTAPPQTHAVSESGTSDQSAMSENTSPHVKAMNESGTPIPETANTNEVSPGTTSRRSSTTVNEPISVQPPLPDGEKSPTPSTPLNVAAVHGSNVENESDQPTGKPALILYRIRLIEPEKADRTFSQLEPFAGVDDSDVAKKKSHIDYIRDVRVRGREPRSGIHNTDVTPSTGKPRIPVKVEEFAEIIRVLNPVITINEAGTQSALRYLVDYYPGQNLVGRISIHHPFRVLLHYYTELETYQKTYISQAKHDKPRLSHTPEETLTCTEITSRCIQQLLSTVKPEYEKIVRVELERYQGSKASYENLWVLFKPGIYVYARVEGKLAGFVIASIEEEKQIDSFSSLNSKRDTYNKWVVTAWNLSYDGRKISRKSHEFIIPEFWGEKDVQSLEVFPCSYLDHADGGATRKGLVNLGTRYFEILRAEPAFRQYSGYTLDHPTKKCNGKIVLDPFSHYTNNPGLSKSFHAISEDNEGKTEVKFLTRIETADETHILTNEPPDIGHRLYWNDYDKIDPKNLKQETLEDRKYFLFPRGIMGFSLRNKQWMNFDVDLVSEIKWSSEAGKLEERLMLPEDDLRVFRCLIKKGAAQDNIPLDDIEGKGLGKVFLLHGWSMFLQRESKWVADVGSNPKGPPGTGKTYTAECIAEWSERPLLSLTVADIGTREEAVEPRLAHWFMLATRWSAIMLLDEADIFLEQRSEDDIGRNGMVAVFLRTLEYFSGTLFLTTNRVGRLDEAVISRINLPVPYFMDQSGQKRVMDKFIRKVKDEKFIIARDTLQWIIDDSEMFTKDSEKAPTMLWNGREIRNVVQLAAQIAKSEGHGLDAPEILKSHFRIAIDKKVGFYKYLNAVQNCTFSSKARDGLLRYDAYRP